MKLTQLVQKEDSLMRETRFARPRTRPAAHDCGRGRRVVGSAKRRAVEQRLPGREKPGNGMDPRHLERLLQRERRENPREPAREHRLPRPGRTGEQEVMAPRGGELERPSSAFLPTHFREIRVIAIRGSAWAGT